MYAALRPFLNRGGAGYSISRKETAERLRPHVDRGLDLLKAYSAALPRLRDREAAGRLDALLPYFRTELSKLYESVFSVGGTAPTGVDVAFGEGDPGGGDGAVLRALVERERAFHEALTEEVDAVHHQERTRAILKAVALGAQGRLDALRELAGRPRRN
jgi:hypothetical protein